MTVTTADKSHLRHTSRRIEQEPSQTVSTWWNTVQQIAKSVVMMAGISAGYSVVSHLVESSGIANAKSEGGLELAPWSPGSCTTSLMLGGMASVATQSALPLVVASSACLPVVSAGPADPQVILAEAVAPSVGKAAEELVPVATAIAEVVSDAIRFGAGEIRSAYDSAKAWFKKLTGQDSEGKSDDGIKEAVVSGIMSRNITQKDLLRLKAILNHLENPEVKSVERGNKFKIIEQELYFLTQTITVHNPQYNTFFTTNHYYNIQQQCDAQLQGPTLSGNGSPSASDLNGLTGERVITPFGGIGKYENLLKYSEQLDNPVWETTRGGILITPNSKVSPMEYSPTAEKIQHSSIKNKRRLLQDLGFENSGRDMTFSIWLRTDNSSCPIGLVLSNGHPEDTEEEWSAQVMVNQDWGRFGITKRFDRKANNHVHVGLDLTNNCVFYAWGAQLEYGSEMGVYARTENTPVQAGHGLVVNAEGPHLLTGTTHSTAFSGNGAALTGIQPKHIIQDGAGQGQALIWDGKRWSPQDVKVAAESRASMFPGWPDAIVCHITDWKQGEFITLYQTHYNLGQTKVIYRHPADSTLFDVRFNVLNGVFDSSSFSSDCQIAISELYSKGKAFNFIGGGSQLWTKSRSDVYYSGGNVGIGISKPEYRLHVKGHSALMEVHDFVMRSDRGKGGRALVHGGDNSLIINYESDFSYLKVDSNLYVTGPDISLSLSSRGKGGRALVHDGGNILSINYEKDFASTKIHGDLTVTGSFPTLSDERTKTSRRLITGALDTIERLRGYTYRRTDQDTERTQMGVVAQEVEKVFAGAVYTDTSERKLKSVAYHQFIALLIEGVKEQRIEVGVALKKIGSIIQQLTEQQQRLEDRLAKIEKRFE